MRPTRPLIVYVVMLAGAIALFALVRQLGGSLAAPGEPGGFAVASGARAGADHPLMQLFLAVFVVIAAARALGALCARIGQPPVIGEMAAGIALGPSLLGRVWPEALAFLFPPGVTQPLGLASQTSVVLFLFLIGLSLDAGQLRERSHATVVISHASIVAPFVLGAFLALYLYPRYAARDVPFSVFALFSGVAMSVTAFPVLARILTDRGLLTSPLGIMALACAAADDATAWCLLALLTSVAQSDASGALRTFGLTLAYVALMFGLARPLLRRLARLADARGELTSGIITLVFLCLLLSAMLTDWIGIHALFGAFLLGAITPHDSSLSRLLNEKLGDFVVLLALPTFFAFSGLRTEIGLLDSGAEWLDVLLVIAVASLGKFGGTFASAWLLKLPVRDAAALGILMNTRGLMELIVLNVGLDLKVLSPELFTILVLMALVTTVATTPVLAALVPRAARRAEAAA